MTNREVRRQALFVAISAIELQREALGETAANTALFALRQKMTGMDAEPAANQQAELVVLAADLSGFTALAERMDAERVRDAINAMWKVLDAVVESWGGHIDQHAGDGMVALFGLPRPRPNDLERALHTALALQIELALFNEAAQQQRQSWATGWPDPTMRVGVHRGPVFFGKAGVGYGNRRTAVGDTVNLAKALEQAAPASGLLVSTAVAQQLQTQFEMTAMEIGSTNHAGQAMAVDANGAADANGSETDLTLVPNVTRSAQVNSQVVAAQDSQPRNGQSPNHRLDPLMHAYEVVQENRMDAPTPAGLIAGQETRFIGRERELDFLEQALHTVIDGRFPQVVTITAEPGVGTSRLLYEFERRLKLLPEHFILLHTHLNSPMQQVAPLWQELVFRSGGLRLQDSPGVMREKLARTITGGQSAQPATPNRDAYRLADTLLASDDNTAAQPPLIVEALGRFLHAISNRAPIVALLEQLHQADDRSLDILEALVAQHPDLPLLLIATVQPAFLDRRPTWQERPSDPFAPYSHLNLQPLSAIDGRHMLSEALQRLPSPPLRLLDLLAAAGRGNPLFIEETVKWLLNQGTISSDPNGRWRVDMAQVEATKLPASLDELFRVRLKQLSAAEQQLVGAAAVMEPVFWDSALWQDNVTETPLAPAAVDPALLNLEKRRIIKASPLWSFADAQAYTFVHPLFREAAYHDLPAARRQAIRRQVAHWLNDEQQNGRIGSRFPAAALITHYLKQAGEDVQTRALEPIPVVPLVASGR